MEDNKLGTFFLGVIVAFVLYLLWKSEKGSRVGSGQPRTGAAPGTGTLCGSCSGAGCSSGCNASPAGSAAPVAQAMTNLGLNPGQVTPGTPPLGGDQLSFYGSKGNTPDTSFTFQPVYPSRPVTSGTGDSLIISSSPTNGVEDGTVPGSPTVPANLTPVRATAPVGGFSENGFVQRYNVAGVPLPALSERGYIN